jgi:hypothetical protein
MSIVGVGLFYGLYSEGFDRLWVKLLLDNFNLPVLFGSNEVAFFAALRMVGTVLTIFAVRFVEKRVDTGSPLAIGRAMLGVTAGISLPMIGFALVPCCCLRWVFIWSSRAAQCQLSRCTPPGSTRNWIRACALPSIRCSGRWTPSARSPGDRAWADRQPGLRGAAITTSGLLLTPALFLIGRANRPIPGAEPRPSPCLRIKRERLEPSVELLHSHST